MSAKVHFREGNSPNYKLRSINYAVKCQKRFNLLRHFGRSAWQQLAFNECVPAHQIKLFESENVLDLNHIPKL